MDFQFSHKRRFTTCALRWDKETEFRHTRPFIPALISINFSWQDSDQATTPPPPPPLPFHNTWKLHTFFWYLGLFLPLDNNFNKTIPVLDTILWHCMMMYLSVILMILTIIIRQLRTHLHIDYSISGTPTSEAQDVSHHRNEWFIARLSVSKKMYSWIE